MTKRIHEMEAAIEAAQTTPARVDALNRLADHLRNADEHRTRQLAEEALRLAQQEQYVAGIADSLNNLVWCDLLADDLKMAMERALMVLDLVEENQGLERFNARALGLLGLIHRRAGNMVVALESLFSALQQAETVGDVQLAAGIINDVGVLYLDTNHYDEALEQFKASLLKFREIDALPHVLAAVLNNIACVYIEQNEFANAMSYAQQTLEKYRQLHSRAGEARILKNIGRIHLKQGNHEQALLHFSEAMRFAESEAIGELSHDILVGLGMVFLGLKDFEQALVYLQQALAQAIQSQVAVAQYQAHEMLSHVYEQLGDFEQALMHHKRFHEVRQHVFSAEADSRFKSMQVLHQVERARHEQKMLQLRNEALELEIAERERTEATRLERERLQIALEKGRELNRMKTRMMERIAHEFRTPLAIIQTSTLLLTDYPDQLSDEQRKRNRTAIQRQVRYMSEMLDDILTVLRTAYDRPDFRPEPSPIAEVCQVVFDTIKRENPQWAQRLAATVEPNQARVLLDRALFRRILENLIDNAIKFSAPDDAVIVSLQTGEDDVIIKVCDKGIGIPLDEQQEIFEPFSRASNVGEVPGIGLGLTVVRDCVALHNGSIVVESKPGMGSTFILRLKSESTLA